MTETRELGVSHVEREIVSRSITLLEEVGILDLIGHDVLTFSKIVPRPALSHDFKQMLVVPPKSEREFREMGKLLGVSICEQAGRHWRDPDQGASRDPYWVVAPRFYSYEDVSLRDLVKYGGVPLCGIEGLFIPLGTWLGYVRVPDGVRRIDLPASGSHGKIMTLKSPSKGRVPELMMRNPGVNEGTYFALGTLSEPRRRKHLTTSLLYME